jgi:hypothetical protein
MVVDGNVKFICSGDLKDWGNDIQQVNEDKLLETEKKCALTRVDELTERG